MSFLFKNIPNILTLLRMATVPIFAGLMMEENLLAAALIFLAAEITDVLDGIIARRFDIISPFGKIADPFADKLMQLTALFMLAQRRLIPGIIPWLVFFKELFLLVAGLFVIKYRKKIDLSAKWYGKLASTMLFITIMLVFFNVSSTITDLLLWICVGITIFAAVMYIFRYFNQVKEIKTGKITKVEKEKLSGN